MKGIQQDVRQLFQADTALRETEASKVLPLRGW